VLPSLIYHVIPYNDCDYYVHYYNVTEEAAGRSGEGGVVNPDDVRLLERAVLLHGPGGSTTTTTTTTSRTRRRRRPIVEFAMDTEADFWRQYTAVVEKIRTTNMTIDGKKSRPLYFPYKAQTYKRFTTTDNIIKMWHSIQSAWYLMERSERSRQLHYTTVAMLRSDVVYVTKMEILVDASSSSSSSEPPVVTIPAFGQHPVSDRAIYGHRDAVQIWATQRLARLDDHVHWVAQKHPGWGMHSERFMAWTIFPAMRQHLLQIDGQQQPPPPLRRDDGEYRPDDGTPLLQIREDPHWCFLRARADGSVWIRDCEISSERSVRQYVGDVRTAVETAIGRPCTGEIVQVNLRAQALYCGVDANDAVVSSSLVTT
jgi:hypothetical protein